MQTDNSLDTAHVGGGAAALNQETTSSISTPSWVINKRPLPQITTEPANQINNLTSKITESSARVGRRRKTRKEPKRTNSRRSRAPTKKPKRPAKKNKRQPVKKRRRAQTQQRRKR